MNVNSGGIADLSVPIIWDGLFLFSFETREELADA